MSQLLRHLTPEHDRMHIDVKGGLKLADLANLDRPIQSQHVRQVCETQPDREKRFELYEDEHGNERVRTFQGHSHEYAQYMAEEYTHTRVTAADIAQVGHLCVHGTMSAHSCHIDERQTGE